MLPAVLAQATPPQGKALAQMAWKAQGALVLMLVPTLPCRTCDALLCGLACGH